MTSSWRSALVLLLCAPFLTCTAKIIDLSHVQKPETFHFAGVKPFSRTDVFAGIGTRGIYYDVGALNSPEHSGTHLDVPSHFVKGGATLDQVPIEWTIADGVTIDCRKEAENNRDYVVDIEKLLAWEKEHGRIPQGAAVLFQFGWSSRFGNITDYVGSETLDDLNSFRVPALSKAAGAWLFRERDIQILGVDSLSPDVLLDAREMPNHVLYLSNNRIIVENLKIPDDMPARHFRFHATPPKYLGASGTQVRAFAVVTPGVNVTMQIHGTNNSVRGMSLLLSVPLSLLLSLCYVL
ncbi:isatin hydrolase [Aplysia californica]|uniref:Isatin hydrolase n=1 Tax=Aplysia californica TaxID=6500 RepID=A0ABM1ADU1_APLCA|nr:isatin hydrolase [Aplysia californica]